MEYVTSWVSGGWTNDFMTYINMIYLGLISSRTPIIPPFAPSHVDFDAGYPPFGDVFDVPRLAAAINSPLLEWRDVKQENSSETDQIGCWTIWGLVGSDDGSPRESIIPQKLKLDIAYTALPPSSPRIEEGQHGLWMPFWTLAKLGFSWRRGQALAEDPPKTPAPQSGEHILPDERLLCFDFMYFIGAQDSDEWWFPWSPAWRLVGRHTHWEPRLERLALGYIQRALDLPEDSDKFPPYIAVHVRRGDFTAACGHTSPDECFQPISSYARRVADVSAKLFAKHGLELPMHHVLVTSDETDPAWWRGVDELGWRRADHVRERTEERFGKWYPPLIDAVVQSMAVGFVGTDQSTMSLVALRRVEEWQQGVAELVRIGQRGMEEH
ncbi:hypothetical protein K439DRAFT_1626429 [Ramaria rubella]|nr:hypothetical protein K439DRAFT_1626429 [Ramaria rubella]